MKLPDPY